jgi:uncharacterized protein YgbK (DUF1537 family)
LTHAGGGLIVVGSYVPRSTDQVNSLLSSTDILHTEVNVAGLLNDQLREDEISRVVKKVDQALHKGNDIVIFTGRQLMTAKDAKKSLEIGQKVSQGLISIVKRIKAEPRYILAKGGITSSDIATKLGDESRFPGLAYIVFPGNVGDENAVAEVVHKLKP